MPAAFAEPVPDPLGDLVARYARCHGPFTALAVAGRYGLGQSVVGGALHRLAAERRVVEGEFLPGGRGTEWCDVEVLRLLRRRCLAKLRKEVEPAPPEALSAGWPAFCQAGRNAASASGGAGSTSLRSLARQRRRSRRSTSLSHHSAPRPPGRNSPSLTRPCAASRRSAPVTTACPRP